MQKLPVKTIDSIIETAYKGDALAFLHDLDAYLKQAPVPAPKNNQHAKGPVLIELGDVSRTYKLNRKNNVQAVQHVDLQIHEGEIVALTGPSGSGKSTLMQLIAGLDRPTEGTVTVDGQAVHAMGEGKLARYRNHTVGIVFQFFYLQPFLKVDRNIEVPLMFARTKRGARRPAIEDVVEAVSLTDRSGFYPKELSGGQMQRVAIARALVNKPKILLADEPTGNLDSKNSDAIMQLLQTIREQLGTTMIIVTHDPRVAAWADRVVRLEDGKVVA